MDFLKFYTADWIDGKYEEWDSENQQLIKPRSYDVVLKELENIENASQNWFEEVCKLNYFKRFNV